MVFEEYFRQDDHPLTAEERRWVEDIDGSVLERQAREKPHRHEENLCRVEGEG